MKPQPTSRQRHGQYYTPVQLGALLASRLNPRPARTGVELGVGEGALLSAVLTRWPRLSAATVDVDPQHGPPLGTPANRWRHHCGDALAPNLPALLGVAPGSADLAVGNPPFVTVAATPEHRALLAEAGLPVSDRAQTIAAPLLFLAQTLRLLRPGGQLGFIVPAGWATGERHRAMRAFLVNQHVLHEVIELPPGTFQGIEVCTFMLVLTKGPSVHPLPVRLFRCGPDGQLSRPLLVPLQQAISRMDHAFYARGPAPSSPDGEPIGLEVTRGAVSMAQAKGLSWPVLHTTDLQMAQSGQLHLGPEWAPVGDQHTVQVKAGDVVMARVGRGLVQQVARVVSGRAVISDCLYRIRASRLSAIRLYAALKSPEGQAWLQAHTRGACARFLTKADLLRFPLPRPVPLPVKRSRKP